MLSLTHLGRTVALLLIGLLLTAYGVGIKQKITMNMAADFALIYESARAVIHGQDMYQPFPNTKYFYPKEDNPDLSKHQQPYSPNLNSPFYNLVMLPFGYLNYAQAFSLWSVLSVICLLLALALLSQCMPDQQRLNFFMFSTVAMLAYFPSYITVQFGQVSFLLLLLLTAIWLALRRGADSYAGMGLGILLGLKLFFGVFIVWALARRQYRCLFALLITFAITLLLPLLWLPIRVYQHYHAVLQLVSWQHFSWNVSLWGMWVREHALPSPVISRSILIGLLGLMFMGIRKIPYEAQRLDRDPGFAITLILALLLSPLGWLYYFPLLMIPVISAWLPPQAWLRSLPHAFLVAVAIFLSSIPAELVRKLPVIWFNFAKFGYGFYALLMLLVLFSYNGRQQSSLALSSEPQIKSPSIAAIAVCSLFFIALLPSIVFIIRVIY